MTTGTRSWSDEVCSAAAAAEKELGRGISWFNDEVVPVARREGIRLLHAAAQALQDLAHTLEGKPTGTGERARQ